jgi:CYTH domain-containing protein
MGTHAYARVERERRFLLAGLPAPLTTVSPHDVCTDLYLDGLRLRLRSLVPSGGGPAEYKLGQKHQRDGMAAHEREMTTFYLTAAEHAFLAARFEGHGHRLVKRRYRFVHEGLPYVVDAFEGACEGLFIADLELADSEKLRAAPIPAFALREVTDDPRYEGGTLAREGIPR